MPVPDIHRHDFTQALAHLTRDRREFVTVESTEPGGRTGFARLEQFAAPPKLERVVPAFDVLKEILGSGTIRGSGNTGFVKGNRPAVCLSEIPLSVMHHFANPPSQEIARYPRYRFYGIALSKRAVFEAGGRPVIYLPDGEADWIPAEEKWRHVRFEHGEVDFTHEREWRVPGDLDLKKMPGLYVILWSATEARVSKTHFPSGRANPGYSAHGTHHDAVTDASLGKESTSEPPLRLRYPDGGWIELEPLEGVVERNTAELRRLQVAQRHYRCHGLNYLL